MARREDVRHFRHPLVEAARARVEWVNRNGWWLHSTIIVLGLPLLFAPVVGWGRGVGCACIVVAARLAMQRWDTWMRDVARQRMGMDQRDCEYATTGVESTDDDIDADLRSIADGILPPIAKCGCCACQEEPNSADGICGLCDEPHLVAVVPVTPRRPPCP